MQHQRIRFQKMKPSLDQRQQLLARFRPGTDCRDPNEAGQRNERNGKARKIKHDHCAQPGDPIHGSCNQRIADRDN